jgi:hypothetical protein
MFSMVLSSWVSNSVTDTFFFEKINKAHGKINNSSICGLEVLEHDRLYFESQSSIENINNPRQCKHLRLLVPMNR